jgi:hypothetical protein
MCLLYHDYGIMCSGCFWEKPKDGNRYKILPIRDDKQTGKSPLEDIPYIEADITTQEIVELLRESRAGI